MSKTETPAYTVEYQIKILAFMANQPQFATLAGDALEPEHFADRALQWFFKKLGKEDIHHSLVTLREEMIRQAKAKTIKAEEVSRFVEVYDFLKVAPTPDEQTHIQETLGKFVRTQNVRKAITDSFDLIKNQQWEELESRVVEATKSGFDVLSMGQDYFKDFEDRLDRRVNQEEYKKLSTGIPALDELMYGGLKNKQLGLIIGGTGRGKSIFLEWLARIAILHGKKVIYFTCELSEDDIAERFDSMFCRIKPNELVTYNAEATKKLDGFRSAYGTSLLVKEYPADTATVNTLKNYYRQLSAMGCQADLVVVDYLDLLKPHRHYKDTTQELDAITKALHGFAKEMNTRVWTATQLNRSGLAMETPDETSIAGALAKLFTADVAIFMAQTAEEREDEEMRLLVSKNRNGPAGRSIKLDTDYTYYTFYREPVHTEEESTGDQADE